MTLDLYPKNFISKHGFVLPNDKQDQSENGVLFSVVDEFLSIEIEGVKARKPQMEKLASLIMSLHTTNGGSYRTLPFDDNKRFSLDNAIAVAAFSRFCINTGVAVEESEENLAALEPERYWLRFYDVIPFLKIMINPSHEDYHFLASCVVLNTCAQCFIYNPFDSSGRQLAFVKGFAMDPSHLRQFENILLKRGLDFPHVFKTYFPNRNNVNNETHRIVIKATEANFREYKKGTK